MNNRDKITKSRVIFLLVTLAAVALFSIFNSVFNKGASFEASTDTLVSDSALPPENPAPSITEPEDSHQLIRLTFGGTCTPASMLGSSSYGTFNAMRNDMGAEYFFERISQIFAEDDLTVVGCNAVLGDSSELTPAENGGTEWYLAPAGTVDIFTSSGVDAVSLACSKTMDYGWVGYASLKSTVKESGLDFGDAGKAIYRSFGDIDVAVYCCILKESERDGIADWIKTASANNDFVALYVCDRLTGNDETSDMVSSLLRGYIDAGADLIVGTNETQLKKSEKYGDGYIVYSLGALLDGTTKYPEKYTALLSVELRANEGKITDISYGFIPLLTYDEAHPWHLSVIEDGEEKDAVLEIISEK